MKLLNRRQMITLQCATIFVPNGRIVGILETVAPSIKEARQTLINAAKEAGMIATAFELIRTK